MFQNTNTSTRILDNAWTVSDVVFNSVSNILQMLVAKLPYILAGFLVLGFFIFISKIFKNLFWKTSEKTKLDYRLRILVSRIIGIAIVLVGFFTALTVVVPSFQISDLIAGLGFTTFVVGFATKDILNNLFSGILILWKQPFKLGDYIFINKFQGKVDYIGVRATRLRADDGEQILIPNGDMYSNALIIRAAGTNRRMSLKVVIGYNSEIGQAKEAIYEVLKRNEGVLNEPAPNVYVVDLSNEGVNLAIYFWIDTDANKPIEVFDKVATEIKNALAVKKIRLYPLNPEIETSDAEEKKGKEIL